MLGLRDVSCNLSKSPKMRCACFEWSRLTHLPLFLIGCRLALVAALTRRRSIVVLYFDSKSLPTWHGIAFHSSRGQILRKLMLSIVSKYASRIFLVSEGYLRSVAYTGFLFLLWLFSLARLFSGHHYEDKIWMSTCVCRWQQSILWFFCGRDPFSLPLLYDLAILFY